MKAGVTTYKRFGSWYYRFWHRASRLSSPYEKGGYETWRKAHDEGWKKRREVERRPDEGQSLSLADYTERWLTERAQDLEPITLENYRERLTKHVLPELGRLRLDALTPSHVRRFLLAKRKVYAKNGVRLMRASLSSLLSDAVQDELIPANPCLQIRGRTRRGADQVTPAERQQQIRPMTLAQREAFIAAARRRRAHPLLFEVLAKTGLRPSEVYALRADDLDLGAGRVHVERAWVRGRLKATKTSQTRWVDLPEGLVAGLADFTRSGKASSPLFQAPAGGHLDPSKVGKAFRATVKAAKIGRFRLYDLRHTYACLRLADGAPPIYVAAQLGHATPATTFRHYARWIPSAGRQWVERDARPRHRRGDGRGKRKGLSLVTR
jgi:integrase